MSKNADALTIRVARPEEREALEDLQRRASLELPDYRAQLEAHPDAIHLPPAQIANGQVYVAELDGLFVEPALWRRGIGRALVQRAIHEARRKGLSLVVIAGEGARQFYEACGFVLEGEAQTRFGPALRLSR
jgi:GNAT superfamily N-acetyltransferase